jgi:hypothetical protein
VTADELRAILTDPKDAEALRWLIDNEKRPASTTSKSAWTWRKHDEFPFELPDRIYSRLNRLALMPPVYASAADAVREFARAFREMKEAERPKVDLTNPDAILELAVQAEQTYTKYTGMPIAARIALLELNVALLRTRMALLSGK